MKKHDYTRKVWLDDNMQKFVEYGKSSQVVIFFFLRPSQYLASADLELNGVDLPGLELHLYLECWARSPISPQLAYGELLDV